MVGTAVTGVLVTLAVTIAPPAGPALAGPVPANSAPANPAPANPAPALLSRGQLTVGVSLPSAGFEVGVAKGAHVIYAQGLDIDLALAIAKRLDLPRVEFVQSRFSNLFSAGKKPWDIAVAQLTITSGRSHNVSFSQPYMTVDQGVLAATNVSPAPHSLAGLRSLQLCALRGSTGAAVAAHRIAPQKPVMEPDNVPTLMQDLQSGTCQAVVYDAPSLGALKALAPTYYGTFVGLIPTGEHYGVALPKGSPLLPRVDAALKALLADGTVQRLEKQWLSTDLAKVPLLH
ncbi:MAG TPA: ABC transporter substrate-binding protein [Acidimicrobiales bacterium]|nr:ABC transporter substrate-binding protein [Acidimicrobiales bacterium]